MDRHFETHRKNKAAIILEGESGDVRTPTKPGSGTLPFFGVVPKVLDEAGNEVPRNTGSRFVPTRPWPSMLRTLWGDDERFKRQYWSELPGMYFTGDGACQD